MILEQSTRYLSFLKYVPGLPHVLDQLVKIETYLVHPKLLDLVDEVIRTVSAWPDVEVGSHRFGGTELRLHGKEFGHIHSNGLLDIFFGSEERTTLVNAGTVEKHHVYPTSGWTSFHIRSEEDREVAITLLLRSYERTATADHGLTTRM